ncbi:MAG: hypothetical protein HYX88_00035, partial [Chloroflexi bacterium]|nr:hypothetical protein [Chloroflexota bacterium]
AIPVDLVKSVGGLIDVGDRVDLLVSFKETTTGWSSTRQMLSRLRVLEVRDAQGFTVIPKKRAEGDFERSVPAAVVLAATPSEVEQIVHYLENGQIYLALDPLEVESDGGQPSVP